MADFNTQLAGPQGGGAAPLAPVHEQKLGMQNPWVGLAADAASIFIANKAEQKKLDLAAKNKAILSDYANQYNAISDARDSGQIDIHKHNILRQTLFSKMVAANPELTTELKEITGAFREMGSSAEDVDLDKAAKTEDRRRVTAMADKGLPVNMTDSEQFKNQMWGVHQEAERQQLLVKRIRETESHAAAMASEGRSAETYQLKREAEDSVATMGTTYLSSMRLKADELVKNAAGDPEKVKVAQAEWNKLYGLFNQTVTDASKYNPETGATWRGVGKDLDTYFQDTITGKTVTEGMKNKISMLEYGTQAKLMATPNGRMFVTAGKIFPNSVDQIIKIVGTGSLEEIMKTILRGEGAPIINDPKAAAATQEAFKGVTEYYGKAQDAGEKEQARQQGVNIITKSLKDLNAGDIYKMDNKAISSIMKQVDSRFFAEQVAAGKIDPQTLSNATAVTARVYTNPIIKEVNEKISQPVAGLEKYTIRSDKYLNPESGNINGPKDNYGFGAKPPEPSVKISPIDVMNISFVNGKMIFEPKPGSKIDPATQRDLVSSLQSSAEAVGQLVRLDSHTKGSTDYQKTWEERKHVYFPNIFPNPKMLSVGQTVDGFKYIGGDVRDRNNWMEVPSGGQ